MALQIRRGTNAERLSITPLDGELIFTTDTKEVFVGDGITQGGKPVTAFNAEDAQDFVAPMFTNGTHSGISFTYNDASNTINAVATGVDQLSGLSDVALDEPITSGQVLKYNGTSWVNDTDNSSSGILSVQEDLVPTLGGNLDLNSFDITGTGNIDISGAISAALGLGSNLDLNSFDITGTGNIEISGTFTGTSVTTGGLTIDNNSITGNQILFGKEATPISPEFNLDDNLKIKNVVNPTLGKYINMIHSRGTLVSPLAVQTNDLLGGILIRAHTSPTNLAFSSVIATQVDSTSIIDPDSEFIKSKLIIAVSTDTSQNIDKALVIDSSGTASIDTFKAEKCLQTKVYADSAAIIAAISTPTKGMIVFKDDTSSFVGWNGTAWVSLS